MSSFLYIQCYLDEMKDFSIQDADDNLQKNKIYIIFLFAFLPNGRIYWKTPLKTVYHILSSLVRDPVTELQSYLINFQFSG